MKFSLLAPSIIQQISVLALTLVISGCSSIQEGSATTANTTETVVLGGETIEIHPKQLPPTLRDVAYGPDERNKLDFWKAESREPTPLVFYIHGGGWLGGSKESNKGPYLNLLDEGVSYVSINYRLAGDGHVLPASLQDAARALQFVRSKAELWNIDKDRIVVTGGSAGGCSSLWLAFHDDLADPNSDDPVARESTRVSGAAVIKAQTTINPFILDQRIGRTASGHKMIWHSVGAKSFEDLTKNWDQYKALATECSPLTHLTADDPETFFVYGEDLRGPADDDGIHHAEFGYIFKEKADAIGVDYTIEYHGKDTRQQALEGFMRRVLLGDPATSNKS